MGNEKELLDDVVASVVEKILMNLGISLYTMVSEILDGHGTTFSECYQKPEALSIALKQVFSDRHSLVVEEIRNELGGLADDDKNLAMFLSRLSR